MSGLAKSLFLESYQRSPWLPHKKSLLNHSWPVFEAFLNQKRVSYLDYVLTCRLLRHTQSAPQEVAFFICHLILSAKEGHLCVKVDQETIFPDPAGLWQQEDGIPLTSEQVIQLRKWIIHGSKHVPIDLMTELDRPCDKQWPLTPFCRYQNLVYLQRHWALESILVKHLSDQLNHKPSIELDLTKIRLALEALCKRGILLEEQAVAIENGCYHSFSLITGGPGTGKTYTAGYLIKIFWEHLSPEQKKVCKIVLAAPTGKAAANLQKSLHRVVGDVDGLSYLTAKTLHALLGLKGSQINFQEKPSRLSADLILVDECSMIDAKLMGRLFESIKEGARLIFLGDPHQLPSVEAGSIFADLLRLPPGHSISIPRTQLKTCLRAELRTMIDFAQIVHHGQADQALAILQQNAWQGIHRFLLASDKRADHKLLLDHVKELFPIVEKKLGQEKALLNALNGIRILSPLRQGPLGVETINQLLWNHFSHVSGREGWIPVPIMIISNDYRQDLFNGETGVLMRKLPVGEEKVSADDRAYFFSRDGEEVRSISGLLLPKFEYAYCLSVHKSQGSEFDKVVLLMPEGSELFGREVFYTAITRARKQLDIFGSDHVLHKTILQEGSRLSGLGQRLLDNNL